MPAGRDDLYIASAPAGEGCAQVGSDGYREHARRECRALIGQLRRTFGPEPPNCRLHVQENPHDFGTYLSVNCSFQSDDRQAVEYAYRCEAELPEEWDAQARIELGLDPPSSTTRQQA